MSLYVFFATDQVIAQASTQYIAQFLSHDHQSHGRWLVLFVCCVCIMFRTGLTGRNLQVQDSATSLLSQIGVGIESAPAVAVDQVRHI